MQQNRSTLEQLKQSWQTATHKDNRDFTLDVVKVVISALGLIATMTAGVGLYLNYQQGQEKLVTDRFAKSVEQLGSQDIDVRIGAIYSLERIAKDSPKDHWTVMEVLIAFVRNRSPLPKGWQPKAEQPLPDVTTDVQSALTVLLRRNAKYDSGELLTLQDTNLSGANLVGASLCGVNLSGADLKGAQLMRTKLTSDYTPWFQCFTDLSGANLAGANLYGANLNGVDFSFANLKAANLRAASLEGVILSNANLRGATLSGRAVPESEIRESITTDLRDASLVSADLRGANLYGVNLFDADLENADFADAQELTTNQIKAARDWQQAHYSPTFRQQLGLPPEKPKP